LGNPSAQLNSCHDLTIGRLRNGRADLVQLAAAGVGKPVELVLEMGGDFFSRLKRRLARSAGAYQDGQQLGGPQSSRA
jgi:hypothetical protein